MVKNKRDLKSPRRNRSFTAGKPTPRKTVTDSNSATGNIRVIIRVRPPNDREIVDNFRNVVKVINDQMMVFDPKEDDEPFFYHGVQQRNRDLLKRAHKNLHFTFDHVFDCLSNNDNVFEGSTKGLIESLMNGYNCSVFVYGATGAGKTHTMLGNGSDPGITFRTMTELFKRREELGTERDFELGMTYLEVYNETVQDLLNPGPVLHLREDGKFGVIVAGNKLHRIDEPTKLFELLEQGNRNRTQHPTDANAESSRSHAIFQVYLRMKFKVTGEVRVAKLSMIDLAGSERGAATGYSGARFNEGANINKSLLALGNCINSLADGQRHVPYRDSKLTRLLKDSLGGNCQTIMVANISPSSISFEDTYNTLKYAMRATKIKSKIKKNIVNCETNIHHYIQLVEKLTTENEDLKLQLATKESAPILPTISKTEIELPNMELQDELKNLYSNKRELEDKINHLYSTSKLIRMRKSLKEECDARLSGICTNTPDKKSGHRRLGNAASSLERQAANLEREIIRLSNQNEQIQKEIEECLVKTPELKSLAETQNSEIACIRANNRAQFFSKVIELQQRELKMRDNLMEQFCRVLQPSFTQLKGLGYATEELTANYNGLVRHLQGIRSVTWDDENSVDSGVGSSTNITDPEERRSPKRKCEEELNIMDHTFLICNSESSTVDPISIKGDSTSTSYVLQENKFETNADQLMFKVYDDKIPPMEVSHWTDGFGVKQLMTKLYDSPQDEDGPLQPLNQTHVISQTKTQAARPGSKFLLNKAQNVTPLKKTKTTNQSPRILKENVLPFRARPVPITNSVRPKLLQNDKLKGVVKQRPPRCTPTSRSKSLPRK